MDVEAMVVDAPVGEDDEMREVEFDVDGWEVVRVEVREDEDEEGGDEDGGMVDESVLDMVLLERLRLAGWLNWKS